MVRVDSIPNSQFPFTNVQCLMSNLVKIVKMVEWFNSKYISKKSTLIQF